MRISCYRAFVDRALLIRVQHTQENMLEEEEKKEAIVHLLFSSRRQQKQQP